VEAEDTAVTTLSVAEATLALEEAKVATTATALLGSRVVTPTALLARAAVTTMALLDGAAVTAMALAVSEDKVDKAMTALRATEVAQHLALALATRAADSPQTIRPLEVGTVIPAVPLTRMVAPATRNMAPARLAVQDMETSLEDLEMTMTAARRRTLHSVRF